MSEQIQVKLRPIKELWYNDITSKAGYSCVTNDTDKVELDKVYGNFLIVGVLPRLTLRMEYNASLVECFDKKRNSKYYEVRSIFEDIPKDVNKQRVYLNQIVAPRYVDAIYEVYPNQDVISLIVNNQIDVDKIKGVGKKIINRIKNKVEENVEYREAMEFLGQYDINPNFIIKLVKHYNSSKLVVQKVKECPYNLLAVRGIGFKKADDVAMKMKYPRDSKERIVAAIEHLVEENEKEGHTYIKQDRLIEEAYQLLGISHALITEQIYETDSIGIYGDSVAVKKTYLAEKNVANILKQMVKDSTELNFDVEKFIARQEKENNMKLTDQQKQFFYNIKKYNVNLLVGFAGCGKSALQKLVIALLEELGMKYLLLAPTGKASRVLAEYTNRKTMTVHKAILKGSDKEENEENEDDNNYFEEDYVIVDEASMVDVKLASQLLDRINPEKTRILFVGDSFQIPSVNCGLFLHDCIESKVIPTTMLDIVFRQKEGGILDIMTKIRLKEKFIKNDEWGIIKYGDNCIIASVPQDRMEGGYKYYYNELLKKYKPEDIMVLSPQKKGNLGTVAINENLQAIINPESDSKEEIRHGKDPEFIYRENDYVMNTVNTYGILNEQDRGIDIVNGETGYIEKIDKENKEVLLDLDYDKVPLEFKQLRQLLHAWCITLHKSQGSGSKAVIMVVDKAHKFQLNANLIYTGGTRSKDLLVIISQGETLNFAMRKNANLQRNTYLKDMLMGG
ncbi:AAA family ATPase [Metabacillus sp. Hm71]|uniref:AAA family ATPase n=1 Tax=Metabacillus sp. Hm71 TaxID=3450743 RepID=UPI003F4235F9